MAAIAIAFTKPEDFKIEGLSMHRKEIIRLLYVMRYNTSKWRKGLNIYIISLLVGWITFIVLLLVLMRYALMPELAPVWTGFGEYENQTYGIFVRAKTLWDWMELMFVPATLAAGAFLLNHWQTKNSERLSKDNQRQVILETYFDKMADLILTHDLNNFDKADNNESQAIARTRTLTTLRQLDNNRKAQLLQFLQESNLIHIEKPVVNLSGADFSDAILTGAHLSHAKLNGISLERVDLRYAYIANSNLTGVRFDGANLANCNLSNTILTGANFQGANLKGANFDDAILIDVNFRHSNASDELVAASRKDITDEGDQTTQLNNKK